MSVPIQVLRDDGSQELKVSTAVTVLSMMVNAERQGGGGDQHKTNNNNRNSCNNNNREGKYTMP